MCLRVTPRRPLGVMLALLVCGILGAMDIEDRTPGIYMTDISGSGQVRRVVDDSGTMFVLPAKDGVYSVLLEGVSAISANEKEEAGVSISFVVKGGSVTPSAGQRFDVGTNVSVYFRLEKDGTLGLVMCFKKDAIGWRYWHSARVALNSPPSPPPPGK